MGLICGWLSNNNVNHQALIDQMLSAATGNYNSSPHVCTFGNGAMGIRGTTADSSIYYSEEIYAAIEGNPTWGDNFLSELAREKGSAYALAEGFRQNGLKVLDRLHGEFAICVIKPAENYAFLAVDRIGIRPLAYTTKGETFVFASQIDSIRSHPSITAEIDPQGIFNYLYFHMVPSPGTIFRDIRK